MTSKNRLDEVTAMTVAFHQAWCVPPTRGAVAWSDAHFRADRRVAARQVDALHAGGHWVERAEERGLLLSDDVIADAA